MNLSIKYFLPSAVCILLLMCGADLLKAQSDEYLKTESERLVALANQARAQVGAPALKWDPALAQAALRHTRRMVSEGGAIQHDYPGELVLSERAGLSGAHFNLIEENIAVGPTSEEIHDAWMNSKLHRENMLNPEVNRIGIAVIARRGVLYATADFTRAVDAYSPAQVEEKVGSLLERSGVKVLANHALAREACTANRGFPRVENGAEPSFVMRWQDSDLSHLPQNLVQQIASKRFREAAVGTCEASGEAGTFTAYRVAVLLY
ncbi:CAP domain-containing protein [Occallatibacter savannae]|uniref:CAP domain-containing protein n=1 Tax=Occallatibacter savannae TaxID=1002691 RepID=UPI0013A594A5|nr:CAP domain-containing protein [Occallatibacter savannae]